MRRRRRRAAHATAPRPRGRTSAASAATIGRTPARSRAPRPPTGRTRSSGPCSSCVAISHACDTCETAALRTITAPTSSVTCADPVPARPARCTPPSRAVARATIARAAQREGAGTTASCSRTSGRERAMQPRRRRSSQRRLRGERLRDQERAERRPRSRRAAPRRGSTSSRARGSSPVPAAANSAQGFDTTIRASP